MKRTIIAAALLSLLSVAAQAQEPAKFSPVFSADRISVAAGLNYVWYAAPFDNSAPVPSFPRGFEVGIYGAYNLTPHLSLAASTAYIPDNKQLEQRIGLRLRLWRG